jgi:hypothetical protein
MGRLGSWGKFHERNGLSPFNKWRIADKMSAKENLGKKSTNGL